MTRHLRADGRARGPASPTSAVDPFRPALTDIPGACAYLGNVGRSKFYSDLLPKLDIVRFGTRTFITLDSLDRLIAVNCQPSRRAQTAGSIATEPERDPRHDPRTLGDHRTKTARRDAKDDCGSCCAGSQ